MTLLQDITGMEKYLNTQDATSLSRMFYNCTKLTTIDLSGFYIDKVTRLSYMFYNCSSLVTIYAGDGWSIFGQVQYDTDMFTGCSNLVGGAGTTYDDSHVDATYAHIDGGTANPGYFSVKPEVEAYACYTPSNTTLTFYYDNQRPSRAGTTYDLNTGSDDPGWYTDGINPSVTQVAFDPSFADAHPTSTKDWFKDMSAIQSISGIEYLKTEEVTNMSGMFYGCSGLTNLDLSHFNTSKVTNMGGLFRDCSGLKSVNLSSFNTAHVTYMNQMFLGCSSLTSLDLSNFNTLVVQAMNGMFYDCNHLVTIYAGDGWSTTYALLNGGMFTGCTNLVGGMGTTYDANHVNKEYARIDGGPDNPGYFTAKSTAQPGDVSGDGEIDVNDVTMMISCILNDTPVDLATADMNGDNVVDVLDVTMLIAFILNN